MKTNKFALKHIVIHSHHVRTDFSLESLLLDTRTVLLNEFIKEQIAAVA